MLCISMKAGEYFTVGSDTVVQYNHLYGDRVHLMIHAPKEVPIVRGTVLERSGGPPAWWTPRPSMSGSSPGTARKRTLWRMCAGRWTGWATVRRSGCCGKSWTLFFPGPRKTGRRDNPIWISAGPRPVEIYSAPEVPRAAAAAGGRDGAKRSVPW